MDELCQLCLKIGTKRKIKAIQVNLNEALWMCENEECLWPFGYEKPNIFSRRVGDKWAFEWQMYRKVQKTVGRIPVSAELSLYTPPVTPSGDVASKESTKTDLAEVTNTSLSRDDHVFSNDPAPRDSYAPGTSDEHINFHQHTNDVDESKTNVEVAPFVNSTVVGQTPLLSSIFDIDGDKLLDNKFSTELVSTQQACFQSLGSPLDVTKPESVDKQIDLVLERSLEAEPTIEKTPQSKKIVNRTSVTAATQITRSNSKTNTDLKNYPPSKIVKKENVQRFDTKLVGPPVLGDLSDNLSNPKQHTTTITVEGIPPITLSYDLADLGEKSEKIVPVTSTPIQKASKRCVIPEKILVETDYEEKSKPLKELPKKQANLPTKRRTDHGKKYEKFSFSALRKTAQDMKECNEMKVNEVHCNKQESLKSDSRLGIVPLGVPVANADSNETNNSNQTDESLILLNVDANNSSTVENLNLNCLLDDMILDGCQNVSKNLNDDWLESFFT